LQKRIFRIKLNGKTSVMKKGKDEATNRRLCLYLAGHI
jgi:hypothetical protein